MSISSKNTDLIVIYSCEEGLEVDETHSESFYFLDPINNREDARYLLDFPINTYPKNPVIKEDILRNWFSSIGQLEKCFAIQQKWYKDFIDHKL